MATTKDSSDYTKNLSEVVQEKLSKKKDILSLSPSIIVVDEQNNVRESYDPDRFRILKESIKKQGVLEPIHVRKIKGEERYILTHGFNRMKAVNELIEEGFQVLFVSAISSILSEEEELIRHVILNSGEPLTKLEISKVFIQLKALGWKNRDIADSTGYAEDEISKLISFQKQASMEVKTAVKDGIIDINPAIALVKDSENTEEQNKTLNTAIEKAKENVRDSGKLKIKAKDVVKKKPTLSFQEKFDMIIHLFTESEDEFENELSDEPEVLEKLKDRMFFATQLYDAISGSLEAGEILQNIVKKIQKGK